MGLGRTGGVADAQHRRSTVQSLGGDRPRTTSLTIIYTCLDDLLGEGDACFEQGQVLLRELLEYQVFVHNMTWLPGVRVSRETGDI